MGLLSSLNLEASPASLSLAILGTVFAALLSRIFYTQYLHPLSKFPGPWWVTSFSVVGAIISVKQKEPDFFMYLVRRYGSKFSKHQSFPRWTLSVAITGY
jgi:hypothetical protein